jgi:hypothetical protein
MFRHLDTSAGRTADDVSPVVQPDNAVLLLLAALRDDVKELKRLLE